LNIEPEEEKWFDAGWMLHFSFDGTEWERIYTLYKAVVEEVKARNFFR
jgi:hypothetical protein